MVRQKKKSHRTKIVATISIVTSLLLTALGAWYLSDKNVAVLNPQGVIADKQLTLMIFTTLLGLAVIIPVFIMLFVFARKYRDGHTAKYEPEEDGNSALEFIWWGIPIIIIVVLSIVTWYSTHDLDPYKKLESTNKPVKVQVVALQWRWLFIYPEERIATINELRIPEKTPIEFELSADAPMSAFWIPSLGSQIYAMNGMTSKLSLMANSVGDYEGRNTNISGEGYADMQFKTYSMTKYDYEQWTKNVLLSKDHIDWSNYESIAQPTRNTNVQYMMLHDISLFDKVVAKYMDHSSHGEVNTEPSTTNDEHSMMNHEGMNH